MFSVIGVLKSVSFWAYIQGAVFIFMLRVFEKTNKKDLIRMVEHFHEEELKKQLASFGIFIDFAEISHYGLTSGNTENKKSSIKKK